MKCPHEDLDSQRLHIKHVNVEVYAKTARLVCNIDNQQEADDAEETVSAHVRKDVKIYQLNQLGIQRDEELQS